MTEIWDTENAENPRALRDHRAARLADILRSMFPTLHNILVVGCGDGMEAAVLANTLQASVTGIDVETQFSPLAMRYAKLQYGNALDLQFVDESFDFVYSYHALEHIPDPLKALAEMRRVLRVGGGYLIGTPNRHRLIGYIGSDVDFATKLRWNVKDWRARILFRFRNEYGAHAGFSRRELSSYLTQAFGNARDINHTYYAAVYSGHTRALDFFFRTGLQGFLLPSVYFTGIKA
jgi:ubiquinone/menaquinone biosynthesis C-methylase UbiE